jgi:predicted phage tail protein
MLRNIKLYGSLAIDTGVDAIKLDVNNSALLFSGLKNLIPDFKKATRYFKEIIVVGTKLNGEKTEIVPTRDLQRSFGDCDTIHIMPSVEGDISAAFWAVAVGIADTVGETAALYIAAAVVVVGAVAVMYGLSALAQALAPKPTTGQSDTSFIFSGPTNTANQGGAVPIIYGTCLVGSTIIASNILTIQVPVGTVANTAPGIGDA